MNAAAVDVPDTGFEITAFWVGVGWAILAITVVLALTFLASRVAGKHSVIDTAWGLLFVAAAVAAFAASAGHGDALRRGLLLGLPAAWGLRLATHIGRRSVGKPEDPRYAELLAKAKGNPDLYALRSVYALQGLLALLVASPILVGMFEPAPVGPVAWIGVGVWAVGIVFEAVGDAQLESWRADPAHAGTVMNVGLWSWTRHPNYFGDACVWWGVFLVAADALPGVATIYAPVIMTLLLTAGSGVRILERHMSRRDGWDEYARRTSVFLPRPPRRAATQPDKST